KTQGLTGRPVNLAQRRRTPHTASSNTAANSRLAMKTSAMSSKTTRNTKRIPLPEFEHTRPGTRPMMGNSTEARMEFKDYYQIMGLARDATQDDIKRAHRRLARKYHPDVSKEHDAEKRFKEVGEAYEVLRDPEKRAA